MGGFSTPSGGGVATVVNIPFTTGTLGFPASNGTTNFFGLGFHGTGPGALEANVQVRMPKGTIKRLRIHISQNTLNGATIVTLRVNGLPSILTLTIGAGLTGSFTDDIDTVSIALNDLVSYVVDTTASGAGSMAIDNIQIDFTST